MSRDRTILGQPTAGVFTINGNPQPVTQRRSYSRCIDATGRSTDHDCNIEHVKFNGSLVTRAIGSTRRWTACPANNIGWSSMPLMSTENDQVLLNRLLAATGPLTPKINVPLAVYELKDLPMMLKHAGDYLHGLRKRPSGILSPKEAASWNLAVRFGWGPLLGDLGKMLQVTDMVRRRQQELAKAGSSRGLKRRIKFFERDDDYTEVNRTTDTQTSTIYRATTYFSRRYNAWGTIRWKLKTESLPAGYMAEPSFDDAFRSALGLNKGMIPISVWKALPWSWASDWFVNISDVLQANYNLLYYRPSNACIMHHRLTTLTHPDIPNAINPIVKAGKHSRESKIRNVYASPSASATLTVPFLDGFKLSVLGSFAILGLYRR